MAKRRTQSARYEQNRAPLRIIGGRWRGRKLTFTVRDGLRPTGDRIRETLFNWLAPLLPEARVLDLFAGSGALGLEALSRGAREVTMIERDSAAARALGENLALLGGSAGQLVQADAFAWLADMTAEPFDVVFVDPPFAANLWQDALDALAASGRLAPGAAVYVESDIASAYRAPPQWQLHREKTAGRVRYCLYLAGN